MFRPSFRTAFAHWLSLIIIESFKWCSREKKRKKKFSGDVTDGMIFHATLLREKSLRIWSWQSKNLKSLQSCATRCGNRILRLKIVYRLAFLYRMYDECMLHLSIFCATILRYKLTLKIGPFACNTGDFCGDFSHSDACDWVVKSQKYSFAHMV